MADQIPFGTNDFAENPEPRVPCVLLLDTSGSMQGNPIAELNAGLLTYRDHLISDSLSSKRAEIAVVTFGPVQTILDFTTADHFNPPMLSADGNTPMGEAITTAIDMVTARKQVYRQNGIGFYRPWIFLITDGTPTDAWQDAARRVKEGEAARAFSFFAIGIENADMDTLNQIAVRKPLKLKGLSFREMFVWLSHSQQAVSRSTPGDTVPLASPQGWATV
jgi:uncharacterized protein YegL